MGSVVHLLGGIETLLQRGTLEGSQREGEGSDWLDIAATHDTQRESMRHRREISDLSSE